MRCPRCDHENPSGASFCNRCGAILSRAAAAPPPVPLAPSEGGAEQLSPGPGRSGYMLTHRGESFGLGSGPDFYGVWNLRTGGAPVAWFERSPLGWEAASRRWRELERQGHIPSWRGAHPVWVIVHTLIAVLLLPFTLGLVIAGAFDAAGRSLDDLPRAGAANIFFCATAMAGWLLFVYAREPTRTRLLLLVGLPAIGALVVLLVSLSD